MKDKHGSRTAFNPRYWKSAFILTCIGLYLNTGIALGQNVEPCFMETDIKFICEIGLDFASNCMQNATTREEYFFYKGKAYAYSEILKALD